MGAAVMEAAGQALLYGSIWGWFGEPHAGSPVANVDTCSKVEAPGPPGLPTVAPHCTSHVGPGRCPPHTPTGLAPGPPVAPPDGSAAGSAPSFWPEAHVPE